MNEFERHLLDTVQFSTYIASFADQSRKVLAIENYAYSVDALGVDIDDTEAQDFNLIMDSDSDFVVVYMSGGALIDTGPVVANGTRVTEFSPALLIQITDQAAGKTYFNIPSLLPLIAGAGGFPYLMAAPRIIHPRTTLTVSAQGAASGAVFNDFYFTLHGAKIYYA
jgi:hypothetical protein